MLNAIRIIMGGLYKCHDDSFDVNTLGDWCWELFPVLVSYCCDIPKGKTCVL